MEKSSEEGMARGPGPTLPAQWLPGSKEPESVFAVGKSENWRIALISGSPLMHT